MCRAAAGQEDKRPQAQPREGSETVVRMEVGLARSALKGLWFTPSYYVKIICFLVRNTV